MEEILVHKDFISDKAKELFDKNIKLFEEYIPNLAQYKNYTPKQKYTLFAIDGECNLINELGDFLYQHKSPRLLMKNQVNYILSKYHPKVITFHSDEDIYGQIHFRYVNKALELISKPFGKSINEMPICIVYGCGLGYHIEELISKVQTNNLIIIEPEEDMFYFSLYGFDWSNVILKFKDKGCLKFFLGDVNNIFSDIENFYISHGRFLSGYRFDYVHYFNDNINIARKEISHAFPRLYTALGYYDDILYGLAHGLKNIANHNTFVNPNFVLSDEASNIPVFIIGNGPSLDNDIEFLKQNRNNAIYVACGSALDTLRSLNIKPDIYACTERTPSIAETLEFINDDEYLKDIILICGDVVFPKVVDYFPKHLIFGKRNEPLYWELLVRAKEKVRDAFLMNPMVSNMAISGMLSLGFKKLYLFGVDCGKKNQNNHSVHSKLYNVIEDGTRFNHIAPGNFGGEVTTSDYLHLSANNIEIEAKRHVDCKIFNCSDGIKIENTIPLHSSEISIDTFNTNNKNNVISEILSARMSIKGFEITDDDRSHFCDVCDKLISFFDENISEPSEYVQRMTETSLYLDYTNKTNYQLYSRCLEGSVQTFFIVVMYALYSGIEDGPETAKKIIHLYKMFLEDAKKIFQFMPHYCMDEYRDKLNNKLGYDHEGFPAPEMPDEYFIIKR